jgi:hypothetical protein
MFSAIGRFFKWVFNQKDKVEQVRDVFDPATPEQPEAATPEPEAEEEEVSQPVEPPWPVPRIVLPEYKYNTPKTVRKGGKYKTALPIDKDWALDMRFVGMKSGGFQRYTIQPNPLAIDLFHHGGKLAIRYCRNRVRFRGASVGDYSRSWPHDHAAFTVPVSLNGNHTIELFWDSANNVLSCKHDNFLVGRWVCEIITPPKAKVEMQIDGCKRVQIKRGIAR